MEENKAEAVGASSKDPSFVIEDCNAVDQDVQVIWVIRHGDRMDSFNRKWKQTAEHPEDTPLSEQGHKQAVDVARWFTAQKDIQIRHVLASPFLRTIQTSLPTSKALNLPIKLEPSVWETGCRKPPPAHTSEGFPINQTYEGGFFPACGERPKDFRPRLARAAKIIKERFPVGSGDVAIFSHADPTAYMATELCGIDPGRTGPVAPCCIFRCERRKGEKDFTLVRNASIEHITLFGKTEPCHPIHAFADWCRLFERMRQTQLADSKFRWPPKKHEMVVFKREWHQRYKWLYEGKTEDGGDRATETDPNAPPFPVKPPPKKPKVKFNCPQCGVVSYVSHRLFSNGGPNHNINCWKCRQDFKLGTIKQIK